MRVFFGPPVTDGYLRAMSPSDYRNYAYSTLAWNGTLVPALDSILPSGTKTVRLIAGSSREDILIVKSLIAHLGDRAERTLPNLQTLTVSRATSAIGDQLISAGQSAVAWKSVCDIVRSEGYHFTDLENPRASWHKEFYSCGL